MRYTIAATELYNGLANILHFAGNERNHPELNTVLISTGAKTVSFTAASREAVAQAVATVVLAADEQLPENQVLITAADAKSILAFAKPLLKKDSPLVIVHQKHHLAVGNPETGEMTSAQLADTRIYPEVDKLWPSAPVGTGVGHGVRLMDPILFRKLSKVRSYTNRPWNGSTAMSLGLGENPGDSILVTYRDWFRALLRPLDPGTAAGVQEGVSPHLPLLDAA